MYRNLTYGKQFPIFFVVVTDHVSGDAGYSGYVNNTYSKIKTNYVSVYRGTGTDIVDANAVVTCQQKDGSLTTPFIDNKVLY